VNRGTDHSIRRSARQGTRTGDSDDDKAKKKLSVEGVWREARGLVWARRWRLGAGLLLMVISRLAALVLPATSKYVIDEVIGKGRSELLIWLAAAAMAATIVQAATSFGLSQILGVAAQRSITEMRRRVQEHVTRLPTAYFDSTKSGVLISRIMTDAQGIRNLVGTGLVQLVGSLVTAVAALAVLFWLNWRLTSVTLFMVVLFAAGMAFAFKKLRPIFRERGRINADVTGRLSEALGGVRVVKAYTAEKREDRVFTHGVHDLLRNVATTITAMAGVSAGSTLIFGGVGVLMMVVGARSILAGEMTLGDFVMYVFFTGMVISPVVQMAGIGTQLSEAFAGLDRIRELLRERREDEDADDREPVGHLAGHLAFDDVWFSYEEGVPVLKGITFDAPAGTTTALVGSSGSGKSTLVSLVGSFNRPDSGSVLVDGRDLAGLSLSDYRSRLGVVLQDNFLFDGTVTENIRYSRPGASQAEIEQAARVANAHGFVSGFEDGYETVIGERGVKLSGGQRQRIAIARAVLANPQILILDEATSSLDSESEALIQEALGTLRRGRTTFVIAHRLSTIQSADQILVIEDGQIVERGTHGELLALGGRYRELYDRQHRLETNRFVNPGEQYDGVPEAEAEVAG
jgi:subfamily B ATP-binding cassette protein MsbA